MPDIKRLRDAAKAWAAQEQADINAGVKKPPVSSLEQFMAERNKPLKTALVREVEPGRNRSDEALKGGSAGPSALGSKAKRAMTAAETGEAQAFVGKLKSGLEQRTQQHHLQSREFTKTQEVPGAGRKDLGRSTLNVIKSESGKSDGGSLMTLAKKRQARGQSIAGKPGNLDGSRQSLSNALRKGNAPGAKIKGIAGKLGGKLGMFGVIKGVVEGADTLRKLKSGAYDLTPEGTAKPKKGVVES